MEPLRGGAPPIEAADRPLAEIQAQIERDLDGADRDRAGQIGQTMLVARLALAAFEVIVVPIDALEMARGFVFGGDRVVEVDVDELGQAWSVGLLERPAGDVIASRPTGGSAPLSLGGPSVAAGAADRETSYIAESVCIGPWSR